MDDDVRTCCGKPFPAPYAATHRGTYRAELYWQDAAPMGKHRDDGWPVLAHEQDPPRPRPRLGWRDRE